MLRVMITKLYENLVIPKQVLIISFATTAVNIRNQDLALNNYRMFLFFYDFQLPPRFQKLNQQRSVDVHACGDLNQTPRKSVFGSCSLFYNFI